jgi:hypothetical protein
MRPLFAVFAPLDDESGGLICDILRMPTFLRVDD